MRALDVELHAQETVDFRRAPSDTRELVDARAGVQHSKERLVCVLFSTKNEAIVQRRTRNQLRDGNTPTSAIQKFIARFGCMFECG